MENNLSHLRAYVEYLCCQIPLLSTVECLLWAVLGLPRLPHTRRGKLVSDRLGGCLRVITCLLITQEARIHPIKSEQADAFRLVFTEFSPLFTTIHHSYTQQQQLQPIVYSQLYAQVIHSFIHSLGHKNTKYLLLTLHLPNRSPFRPRGLPPCSTLNQFVL